MEPLRILTGQTASGKSAVAVRLAQAERVELISVDSMKVYRGLDIGTAKPSLNVRETVPFHLVDVVDPQDTFTLGRYLETVNSVMADIAARGRSALFVGGTPLYLRGLIYGVFDGPAADWKLREALVEKARRYGSQALHDQLKDVDAVTAARLHPNDLRRFVRALEVAILTGRPIAEHQVQYPAPIPSVCFRMVALRRSEADLRDRVNRRVDRMFEAGLIDEVRRVLACDHLSRAAAKAIGYREVTAHLQGERTLRETVDLVKRNTWRLARKQRTWLKSFPNVHWLDLTPDESPEETTERTRKVLFGPETMN